MSNAPTPLWAPGVKVGRSTLLANLASGGMAEIWLARQEGVAGFEKLVVVKRMIGALQDDPEHVEMFLAEARLAAGLSHRNIVQIYELGQDAGSFFIVMEFIEGDSLARVLKDVRRLDQQVPVPIAVQLVAWAAEALHFAHNAVDGQGQRRGVIHRDISPQNLLLTADGSIKVVDFGIAKHADEDTRSGKLKGKLAYMPPEQARADPLDVRADVYSLGVVLFELLTGTRLFGKLEELELLKRLIAEQPLPRARERRPELPEALEAIVTRAMAPQRDARYPTAQALQDALEDWLVSTGARVNASTVSNWVTTLFPERVQERRALIEAARRGQDISTRAGSLLTGTGSQASNSNSNPGSSSGISRAEVVLEPTSVIRPAPRRGPMAAGVVGALVLVLAAVFVFRPSSAEVTPVDAGVGAALPPSGLSVSASVPCEVSIDGKVLGQTPVDFDIAPGEHVVRCEAPGFAPSSKTVVVQPGKRAVVSAQLEALPPPVVEDAGAPAYKAPVVAKVGSGKLNLKTTPWTTVYFGKRKLGETPLVGVTLPAGSHVLRLENAEAGVKSSIEVVITANETTTETLSLK